MHDRVAGMFYGFFTGIGATLAGFGLWHHSKDFIGAAVAVFVVGFIFTGMGDTL